MLAISLACFRSTAREAKGTFKNAGYSEGFCNVAKKHFISKLTKLNHFFLSAGQAITWVVVHLGHLYNLFNISKILPPLSSIISMTHRLT
jgi:hypothetical protein